MADDDNAEKPVQTSAEEDETRESHHGMTDLGDQEEAELAGEEQATDAELAEEEQATDAELGNADTFGDEPDEADEENLPSLPDPEPSDSRVHEIGEEEVKMTGSPSGNDRPLSGVAQLADEPSDVMLYPEPDEFDQPDEQQCDTNQMKSPVSERLETAPEEPAIEGGSDAPDEGDVPKQLGHVVECRGIPTPPPLLQDGIDDLETPRHEDMATSILSMAWSFGINKHIAVINLTTDKVKKIFYTCANVGVVYDYVENKQLLLQGHSNSIICTCGSKDKRWVVTADKGQNSMVIVWDSRTGVPVKTIFDLDIEGGCVAVALTPDSRYLATMSAAERQTLAIWEWTLETELPVCTAQLDSSYGCQTYLYFNPDNGMQLVSNSESQVIFYGWSGGKLEYYAPPLTDYNFNKPVGKFSQTVFLRRSSRAITATALGHLVIWDANKSLVLAENESTQDKQALKMIRIQERPITVLTATDDYIVSGDVHGQVKIFDQTLKLIHWYHDLQLGPVNALSFAFTEVFDYSGKSTGKYPLDSTIKARPFVMRDFVVGTSTAVVATITIDNTDVKVILKEYDEAINAVAIHPTDPIIAICSHSGLMKLWQYKKRVVITTRTFDKGHITCASYDAKGQFIAIGFTNGALRLVDALSLEDCLQHHLSNTHNDAITHVGFSPDAEFLATADAGFAVTIYRRKFKAKKGVKFDPYTYLGRYRGHYKPICDMMFGMKLDSNVSRLLTLGKDRYLVEYDLDNSMPDDIRLLSSYRVEQSAIPLCMAWYPPITKESFIITANNQYKFKLYNSTTKMCRKTILGPTYGSPLQKILLLPSSEPEVEPRFLAFMIADKVGIAMLPVTGNPFRALALIAHPQGVSTIACSPDGKYLFTAGGQDCTVAMWKINTPVLEVQNRLGGEGLVPFFSLLDGGQDGELLHEMEDYFYYAQLKCQGLHVQETREVSETIPLSEIPSVMRALGYYPTEQEIEEMTNEVKFSQYVQTGEYVNDISLSDFIPLYINHRPPFGLQPELVRWAFKTVGDSESEGSIDRSNLLHMLQTRGEKMTEDEIAEHLSTLLGYNTEGGSCETTLVESEVAGDIINKNFPDVVTADVFINSLLGFGECAQQRPSHNRREGSSGGGGGGSGNGAEVAGLAGQQT